MSSVDNLHIKPVTAMSSSDGRTNSNPKTSSLGSAKGIYRLYLDKRSHYDDIILVKKIALSAFSFYDLWFSGHSSAFAVRQGRNSRMSSNASSTASSAPSSVDQQHTHSHSNSDSGLSSLTGNNEKLG